MHVSEFEKQSIPNKSVLIVEPNPYHGEILPGFTSYFQDLGFAVDLFVRNEVYAENPFSLFRKNVPRIFHGDLVDVVAALKSERISEYDFIFFSTNVLWESGVFVGSFLSYLGFVPKAKFGILSVEHNLPYLKEDGAEYQLRDGRVFTLFEETYENEKTLMLNPHRFGVENESKRSHDVTRFAVVGGVNAQTKNFDLLFSSVRRLMDEGLGNFEVTIMGSGELEIPEPLRGHIKFLGRKNFEELYRMMAAVDFLLPLLDSGSVQHKKYLRGTTSGIIQLSLGFHVPMVIDRKFSDRYGFDGRNCIRYAESFLHQGMADAMQMRCEQRDRMRHQIALKSAEAYSKSLDNLKSTLKRLMNDSYSARIVDDATMEVLLLGKQEELRVKTLQLKIDLLAREIEMMKRSKFWKLRERYGIMKEIIIYPYISFRKLFQKNRGHLTNIARYVSGKSYSVFAYVYGFIGVLKFRKYRSVDGRTNIAIQLESFDKGGLEEVVYSLVRRLSEEYNVFVFVVGSRLDYLGLKLKRNNYTVINLHRNTFLLRKLLQVLDIRITNLHYSIFGIDEYERRGVKILYTIHNNYIWSDGAFVKERMLSYRKVDRFIAVSGQVKDYFCGKFGVSSDSVAVVNNGLDLALLETFRYKASRSQFGISEDDFVFINVASFNWNKFHILMVAAMRDLVGKYPKFKLLLVGNVLDQHCFGYVRAKIEEYGLQDSIHIIPYVPKEKVLALMRIADCFVFPSLTEGWGIATTEAMYCELPLIVSDVGGARDLIRDSDVGIIVPNPYPNILDVNPEVFSRLYTNDENLSNLKDLTGAMEEIYLHRDRWKSAAKIGKQKISEMFNVDSMIRGYLDEFNGLLRN